MSSFLKKITAPSQRPVSFDDATAHLRLTELEKPAVQNLIEAATHHIDGREGYIGRALITQTWELHMDRFPCGAIKIPLPPLQEVVSIKYDDTNGDEQTIATEDYSVIESEPAQVLPAYGSSWPSARCRLGSVRVRFTCGYGNNPQDVPVAIRQAILLLVGHWYENREAVTPAAMNVMPIGADALLLPYRVVW